MFQTSTPPSAKPTARRSPSWLQPMDQIGPLSCGSEKTCAAALEFQTAIVEGFASVANQRPSGLLARWATLSACPKLDTLLEFRVSQVSTLPRAVPKARWSLSG